MADYPHLEQYVSDEDGPTCGWRWHIDAEHSVWCGEISRSCFAELDDEDQEAMHDDYGWFIVLYGKTRSAILGKALNEYQGRDFAEVVALGLTAHPDRIDKMLRGDNG